MKDVGHARTLPALSQGAVEKTPPIPDAASAKPGLHQWFERQADRTPAATAVWEGGRPLTYAGLERRANQVARHLQRRGLGPDDLVGVCLPRSVDLLAALLGILKAGAAYLPLAPSLPTERLALLLREAQPRFLIGNGETFALFPGHSLPHLDMSSTSQQEESAARLNMEVGLKYLAYAVFTSGTTGTPKLVGVEHANISNLLAFATESLFLAADVRLTPFLDGIGGDSSIHQIFVPLSLGGALVVISGEGGTLALSGLEQPITYLGTTPSGLRMLFDMGALPPSVRCVGLGAEVIPPRLLAELCARKHVERVFNFYGPTETTIYCTVARLFERNDATEATGTWEAAEGRMIGEPIANTRAYIVDGHGREAASDAEGELWVAGECVTRGYLNSPAATAERFGKDPFAGDGARLYRTGDRVRRRPAGGFEFLGRLDDQVKIRGFRVELGEVEAALWAQPDIKVAAVVMRREQTDQAHLAAFLVGQPGAQLRLETLRAGLEHSLPEHMIPQTFTVVQQLPLTPTGKVDRKALLELSGAGLERQADYCPPRTEMERELAKIWESVFSMEKIGIRDNFFELGGHSLLAARLAAEIDKLRGTKIPVAAFFQSPTIASLAERLAREDWTPPWSSLVPLQPAGSRTPLFFIHGWGGDVYNFLDLTRALGTDQPSYGVQAAGLDGKSARHTTLTEMTAHYVREISSFQPAGSIQLAGYSMGGIIAYEVARQLRVTGRRVGVLALLDTTPAGPVPLVFRGYNQLLHRYWFHFRRWCHMPVPEKRAFLGRRWATVRAFFNRMPGRPQAVAASANASEIAAPPAPTDYYHDIVRRHSLRPYAGSADVFASDDFEEGWRFYWRYLVRRRLRFHRVPGKHLEIFSEKNLPFLVTSLKAVLEDARLKDTGRRPAEEDNAHNIS